MSNSLQATAPRGRSPRRLLFVLAGLVLAPAAASAVTLHFQTDAGELEVEIDDQTVKVAVDGLELKITGAGPEEIRLRTGPHLFHAEAPEEVLAVTKEGRVVVRVRAGAERAVREPRSREELLEEVRQIAGELVSLRSDLDARVWSEVSSHWTTTEAAKLLIAFFRGDGSLPGFNGAPAEAEGLRRDLASLRKGRALAFALLSEAARIDSKQPASPLGGTWEIVDVQGAGGIAADALELYDPDPIKRKFVAANDAAALLTGAGFWLFDARYDGDDGVDLSAVVRGNTVYRGRFQVDGDEATLRISPMNTPRPAEPDGDPNDGGFVLRLRRVDSH